MVEILHPGVYVLEKFENPPAFEGVGVSAAGFIGVAEKGPIQSAGYVSSYTEFVRKYGSFFRNNYLSYAVKAFFDQGGTRCWIARCLHSDAVLAFVNLDDILGVDTVKVSAANKGAWGNSLKVDTLKFETVTTSLLATGGTAVDLASVRGIVPGDVLHLDDGTTDVDVVVLTVNTTSKTITFKAVTLGASIAIGASADTCTTHKVITTTAENLATGATSVLLTSVSKIEVGTNLVIAASNETADVVVTRISGNRVFFDAVTLSATIASGAIAVSIDFSLHVYDADGLVETFEFLSMQDTNLTDYLENRLAGRSNASDYVVIEDLSSASAERYRIPRVIDPVYLATGADGTTVTDNDIIGSDAPGAQSGMYLFDTVDDLSFISAPGYTAAAVQQALATYCENRGDLMAIGTCPLSVDTVEEAEDYRKRTLNIDSSYYALYFPWVVIADPERAGQLLEQPQDGYVAGIYADVAVNRGVHKAPANERLRNVVGLTTDDKDIDWDAAQDILNPIGVNVTRPFSGRGIRVFGARTLWSVKDQRHYVHVRRTLNYIEKTIKENSLFAVFEPNDEDLWRRITVAVSAFLFETWRSGALAPRSNKEQAYFVKCDEETNPQSSLNLGKVNCQVGVNITGTAEFVVFTVSRYDGGRLVQEVL